MPRAERVRWPPPAPDRDPNEPLRYSFTNRSGQTRRWACCVRCQGRGLIDWLPTSPDDDAGHCRDCGGWGGAWYDEDGERVVRLSAFYRPLEED